MKSTLERKYTWTEIGNLFADRIEDSKIISKKWNRKKFLSWFAEREKIGICFDWKMVARAYIIWKDLHDESDHFTVIVGGEGTGKSTFAMQLGAWVAPKMDITDVVFQMPNYIRKLREIVKYREQHGRNKKDYSINIDEGGLSLFSREAMSRDNRLLSKSFMTQRFLNAHVEICIPKFKFLDTSIREHRIKTLIVIKERGFYKGFTKMGVEVLNRQLKNSKANIKTAAVPYGSFWEGYNNSNFPKTIDKAEYEAHKLKHIKRFLAEAPGTMKEAEFMSVTKMSRLLSISTQTIQAKLGRGEIKGKKIGGKWIIPIKEYERLTKIP